MFKHTMIGMIIGLLLSATTFVQMASSQVIEQIQKVTATDAASEDWFGFSAAISGDIAVVGAIQEDEVNTDAGAVYVFERDFGETDSWGERAKLIPSDGGDYDYFGYSVGLSGDTAIVGAYANENQVGVNTGAAYIFERNQGGANNWGNVIKLGASDGSINDCFGISAAIDGDTALVGAYGKNVAAAESGAAYIFKRNQDDPGAWDEVIRLVAYDAAAYDRFGVSVAIDGDTAVVGSYYDDDNGSSSGSAYVFERNQGGPDIWGNVAKLTASDGAADDTFGIRVSVSGDYILVGARDHDGAEADSGAAYIFKRDQGDGWGQVAKLVADDAAAGDHFGSYVSISGDIAAVGASQDDDQGVDSGSLYIFLRNQGGPDAWGQVEKHIASDGTAAAGDEFGFAVSMRDGLLIAGAYLNDGEASDAGSAYIFDYSGLLPGVDPELSIPTAIPASAGDVVSVPIEFTSNGNDIAGVAFSIDFDEICLDFDPTDGDADDIPDAIQFSVPVHFDLSVFVDLADANGEIDVVIADLTDTAPLSDGFPATVNFTTTCTPNVGETILAPVLFSTVPSPSFGNAAAQSIPGVSVDGSVEISTGIRGDCNDDGVVDVADVIACNLEIFDGDGDFWLDTPGGTFAGNPVGCDSNADTTVDAGDLSCTSRLIFGLACPGFATRRAAARPPRLELVSRLDENEKGLATARIHFAPGDHEINSVVFSLDIDEDVLSFDTADNDGDGRPDAVHFSGARTSHKIVKFDASDTSGELDFIIADLTQHPESIEAEVLVEIEFRLKGPYGALDSAVSFSLEVKPSFGSNSGRGVPGDVYVDRPMY